MNPIKEQLIKMNLNNVFVPEKSLDDIEYFILNNDNFIVYGDNNLKEKAKRLIEGYKKTVVGFIESPSVPKDPILDIKRSKLVVASYHELEIAKSFREQYGLLYLTDYIFFDHIIFCQNSMFHDAIGKKFYAHLVDHQDEYLAAYNCFADKASGINFRKNINFRLKALSPELIGFDECLVDPVDQSKYEKDAEQYYEQISPEVPDSLRKAIAYKISLNQYSYLDLVNPYNNKVIFNVGAYNNTSAMFSYYSPEGRIYAFEPLKSKYDDNLKLAKIYKNIIPVNKGVWSSSGEVPFHIDNSFEDEGTSSGYDKASASTIQVLSLDEFAEKNNIIPDYIKMDIEGAEIEALKGSRNIIRKHAPDLAISMYHTPAQLYEVPLFLRGLNDKYKIYFGHKYYNCTETVCFATTKEGAYKL